MPPDLDSPLVSRPRRPASLPGRGPSPRREAPHGPGRGTAAAAEPDSSPLRDRGISAFSVFTLAMLVMVGLAVLTAIVGQWWILIPVMAVDLAATTAVLVAIARLLSDGDGR